MKNETPALVRVPQAEPVSFPEANMVMRPPEDWDDEIDGECGALPVYFDGMAYYAQWRIPWRHRIALLLTGRVWTCIVGRGLPPQAVLLSCPFKREEYPPNVIGISEPPGRF